MVSLHFLSLQYFCHCIPCNSVCSCSLYYTTLAGVIHSVAGVVCPVAGACYLVAAVIYTVVVEIHSVARVVGGLHCVAEVPDLDIVRLPSCWNSSSPRIDDWGNALPGGYI